MARSPPRMMRTAKGRLAHAATRLTAHRARSGELSQPTGSIPIATSTALTAPSPASRNFHTLPETTGGNAQTSTMSASTAPISRESWRARSRATTKPMTRLTMSKTAVKTAVAFAASQNTRSASAASRFAVPTNSQSPSRFVGPTSETAIRTNWTSGAIDRASASNVAGRRKATQQHLPAGRALHRARLDCAIDASSCSCCWLRRVTPG